MLARTVAAFCLLGAVGRLPAAPPAASVPDDDAALARLVRGALAADPGTSGLDVSVSADAGVVTLAGTVAAAPERRRAFWLASQTPGVRRVVDHIGATAAARTDEDIQRDLARHYAADPLFNENDLRVTVRDGTVHLAGSVDSAQEKSWAEDDAWQPGVRDVDASGLRVAPSRFGTDGGRRVSPPTDTGIREEVLRQLAFDRRVASGAPSVSVRDGVVTLTGTVATHEARAAALAVARQVGGVRRVVDHLRVAPETSR